jgi:hypothetical protein
MFTILAAVLTQLIQNEKSKSPTAAEYRLPFEVNYYINLISHLAFTDVFFTRRKYFPTYKSQRYYHNF